MRDQRIEPRKQENQLPTVFDRVTIHTGQASFTCRAIDAGAHGLGLLAENAHRSKIVVGTLVRVEVGAIVMDAEVLNVIEGIHGKSFRFGVFLTKEKQLRPYQKLLAEDRFSYLLV
jgi:hypothetical protein